VWWFDFYDTEAPSGGLGSAISSARPLDWSSTRKELQDEPRLPRTGRVACPGADVRAGRRKSLPWLPSDELSNHDRRCGMTEFSNGECEFGGLDRCVRLENRLGNWKFGASLRRYQAGRTDGRARENQGEDARGKATPTGTLLEASGCASWNSARCGEMLGISTPRPGDLRVRSRRGWFSTEGSEGRVSRWTPLREPPRPTRSRRRRRHAR
jgi:hypothetical protein